MKILGLTYLSYIHKTYAYLLHVSQAAGFASGVEGLTGKAFCSPASLLSNGFLTDQVKCQPSERNPNALCAWGT